MKRTIAFRTKLALLSLALAAGLVACSVFGPRTKRSEVPPNGWWAERGPVVPHETFPTDCELCHAGGSWEELREDFAFDHLAETGIELLGAHARAECLRCHNDRGSVATFAARGCAGCHEDVHRGQLGSSCRDCHGTEDWRPSEVISIHAGTRFPLVGAHAATACFRCHEGAQSGEFTRADIECVTCHREDLARAKSPDHVAQGWVSDCDRCHIPTSWTGAGFNHATFPLTGAHQASLCADCHGGSTFAGTPSACADCHQGEYDATTDPSHSAASFPLACQTCHSTVTWTGASFNHTTFPLTGAHVAAACTDCHSGSYAGTPSACAACHQGEYDATTSPSHSASGFPVTCQSCHSTSTWLGATFNHSFPIDSGAHKGFDCMDCHLVPGNPTSFSCTHCHDHSQSEMAGDHSGVGGYTWSSPACYTCHPNGKH